MILQIREEPLIVDGDRLRIEQVVQNLLSNAAKYSPNADRLKLCLSVSRGWQRCKCGIPRNCIPVEMAAQLFRPFARAENATAMRIPGMGLGLFISQEIAKAHGGGLVLASDGEAKEPLRS